jgi:hypothetical protein
MPVAEAKTKLHIRGNISATLNEGVAEFGVQVRASIAIIALYETIADAPPRTVHPITEAKKCQ